MEDLDARKYRYFGMLMIQPLRSIQRRWMPAFSLALPSAWLVYILGDALGMLGRILDLDWGLVFFVWGAVAADLATGLVASLRRGDTISPRGLRVTLYKLIEYSAFILLCSAGTHEMLRISLFEGPYQATARQLRLVTDHLGLLSAFFLFWVELMSVRKNVGKGGWFAFIKKVLKSPASLLEDEDEATDPAISK